MILKKTKSSKPHFKNSLIHLHQCPICGNRSFSNVLVGDRYDMKLKTCLCNNCDFVFTNPYPNNDWIDLFYKEKYWDLYFRSSKNSSQILDTRVKRCSSYWDFITRSEIFKSTKAQQVHFVDIGGGEGIFTRIVKDKCQFTTYLLEPNVNETTISQSFKNADFILNKESDLIEILKLQRKPSDVTIIACTHVLEHYNNLSQFFHLIKIIMTKNDFIYIDVPNLLKYNHIKEIHIAHKWHFHDDTLIKLFNKNGLFCESLEEYNPSGHPKSLRALFSFRPNDRYLNYKNHNARKVILDNFNIINKTEIQWNSVINKILRFCKRYL